MGRKEKSTFMEKKQQVILVHRAKSGDIQAFIELCENYQKILYNAAYQLLLNNEDVADCLQETEIRAWHKIGDLKNDATFNSWLFKMMINIAKDMLKKKKETIEFEESHMPPIENICHYNLSEEFNHLSEKYKIPLLLHYYAGFNLKEISEQMNIPLNTVKTRVSRGRVKLKLALEENIHE